MLYLQLWRMKELSIPNKKSDYFLPRLNRMKWISETFSLRVDLKRRTRDIL